MVVKVVVISSSIGIRAAAQNLSVGVLGRLHKCLVGLVDPDCLLERVIGSGASLVGILDAHNILGDLVTIDYEIGIRKALR